MDATFEELRAQIIQESSPEERLHGLAPEELLRALSPEDLAKGLSPGQLVQLRKLLGQSESPDKGTSTEEDDVGSN